MPTPPPIDRALLIELGKALLDQYVDELVAAELVRDAAEAKPRDEAEEQEPKRREAGR